MVRHWLACLLAPLQALTPIIVVFVERLSITGYSYNEMEMCFNQTISAYTYIWAPWFTFDATLAMLAIWAGIKHSKQQFFSPSARSATPWLINVLIQGNVIYFLGWVFTYYCC